MPDDALFDGISPEKIQANILDALQSDLDKREGSFAADMAGPVAVELYKMYTSLRAVQPMVWVNETSGPYLDMAAADIGIEPRKEGARAETVLNITGTPRFVINAGIIFRTEDDLFFSVVENTKIDVDGTATVPVQAENVGEQYNVPAGEIQYQFANDSRIKSVTNLIPAQGGTNPESDTSLYARIVAARQKPRTSGNVHDYEEWALETEGVGAVRVLPLWAGPGTVKVLIASENRQQVDDVIVQRCAEHIEAVRPIGAAVTVASAQAIPIGVTAKIEISSTNIEDIQEQYKTVLDGYFRTLAFTQYEIVYNRVGALLIGIEGVVDYSGLLINGAAGDVTISAGQVPTVGGVVLMCN